MLSLGKAENARFLQVALFQGTVNKSKAAPTLETEVSTNPLLQKVTTDPTLFCTALRKNRFYMFSRREPSELLSVAVVVASHLYSLVVHLVLL